MFSKRTHMAVHGTYPHDSRKVWWKTIREGLDLDEVARLVNAPPDLVAEAKAAGRSEYGWKKFLFINKGYIVLGREEPNIPSAVAGFIDGLGQLDAREVQIGDQAVYMHDGEYRLLQACALPEWRRVQ